MVVIFALLGLSAQESQIPVLRSAIAAKMPPCFPMSPQVHLLGENQIQVRR